MPGREGTFHTLYGQRDVLLPSPPPMMMMHVVIYNHATVTAPPWQGWSACSPQRTGTFVWRAQRPVAVAEHFLVGHVGEGDCNVPRHPSAVGMANRRSQIVGKSLLPAFPPLIPSPLPIGRTQAGPIAQ